MEKVQGHCDVDHSEQLTGGLIEDENFALGAQQTCFEGNVSDIGSQDGSTRFASGLQGGTTYHNDGTKVEMLGTVVGEDLNAGKHFLGNPLCLSQSSYKAYALFTPRKLLFKRRTAKTVGSSMLLRLGSLLVARWRQVSKEDLMHVMTNLYGIDKKTIQEQIPGLFDRGYLSAEHNFIKLQVALVSRLLS